MHIPDDPLFYEKYYFAPGDTAPREQDTACAARGFKVWQTRYATIGVLICWDQWYPEAARITSLLGAQVLFYPTAIGWHPDEKDEWGAAQVDAWRTTQRAHAIANGVYVASPNRIGHEDEAGHQRHHVLRPVVHLRSLRPLPRAGRRRRTGPDRRLRPGADRNRAAQLAVPPRSADRRLRSDPQPVSRLVTAPRVRMPAEWEPHRATWISWPHHEPDWPGKLGPIPWVYAEIARVLAAHERVEILCASDEVHADAADDARRTCRPAAIAVGLHILPTDRGWLRDSAPTGVLDAGGNVVLLSWDFNAWAKYDNYTDDQRVGRTIAGITGLPLEEPRRDDTGGRIVLEGGGIEVNGRGLMLVTEEWLLSDVQVRNPGLGRADYETLFGKWLGIDRDDLAR